VNKAEDICAEFRETQNFGNLVACPGLYRDCWQTIPWLLKHHTMKVYGGLEV